MPTIQLSDEDAAQVRAILLTHAEHQDQQALENEVLQGQLKSQVHDAEDDEELKDIHDIVGDLKEVHEDLSRDCDNLKRLADLFA